MSPTSSRPSDLLAVLISPINSLSKAYSATPAPTASVNFSAAFKSGLYLISPNVLPPADAASVGSAVDGAMTARATCGIC